MKAQIFFGLVLISLLFVAPKVSQTPLTPERTPAAERCSELISSFFKEKIFRLDAQTNSIFDRYPLLHTQIEELYFHDIALNEFYDDFLKTHKRAPTLRDGMLHIYSVRKQVLNNYEWLIREISPITDPQVQAFRRELGFSQKKLNTFKDLDQIDFEIKASRRNGKTSLTSIDEEIKLKNETQFIEAHYGFLKERTGQSNFLGEYGELSAMAASGDQFIARGLVFKTNAKNIGNSYEQEVIGAVKNLRTNLDKKPLDEIFKIVNQHGKGLFRKAQEYIAITPKEKISKEIVIDHMLSMIRTKEIDLVTTNGKIGTWAEVKAYRKPISVELLKNDSYSKKSIYEQLIEHKALRDILGLKHKVNLLFISPTSPITEEAKKLLLKIGYQSYGAQ